MFTEAQKKRLMDWEDHRKAEGLTSGILEDWVDSIPIRQVAVFQKAGIITDFKDYGKDHQKCIRIDAKMLMQAVKEISSPKPVGRPTLPPEVHRANHMIRAKRMASHQAIQGVLGSQSRRSRTHHSDTRKQDLRKKDRQMPVFSCMINQAHAQGRIEKEVLLC